MIKISIRKNHIYLVILFFSYFFRRILLIILQKIFGFKKSLIFCFFMCLGQIFGGITIYIYQYTFLRIKGKSSNKNSAIKLIENEREMNRVDGTYKILFLIFLASSFDFVEFFITSDFIPEIASLSSTADLRLGFIMTITTSLLCTFALRYKIGKHQLLSLIVLTCLSLIIIILEFIYKPKEIELGKYFISYILLFLHFIFRSFNNVIEKYLGEYNFMSPFVIIFDEGLSTFILTSIYSIFRNPFKEISDKYNELEIGKSIVFIVLIVLYFISCAFVNVYKTYCNILYSPMTKSLASYFLNSAFIIYYYAAGNDFFSNGKKNFFYFFINLIFSIIIDFFGLIYNEFFVLNFWNLEAETHQQIACRAMTKEMITIENVEEDNDNDTNDGDD